MANNVGSAPRSITRRRAAVVLFALGSLLLVGCGGGSTDSADRAVDTSGGAELYQANCASCHGADLRGTSKGPSHLSVVYEPGHHSDDAFRSAIANGAPQHHWSFGAMPPVGGLSGSEVDAIIAFVRQVQQQQGLK